MLSVQSRLPGHVNVQFRSQKLERAVEETVRFAECMVVGQIENLATFAKSHDNTSADLLPQRGQIHLTQDAAGQPFDLHVRVRSNGPQPCPGTTAQGRPLESLQLRGDVAQTQA